MLFRGRAVLFKSLKSMVKIALLGIGAGFSLAPAANGACDKLRYSFANYVAYPVRETDIVPFGPNALRYLDFSWLRDSMPVGFFNNRADFFAGYTMESNNCGADWYRTSEYLPPMILEGTANANGVAHFVTNMDATPSNQGFATRFNWNKDIYRIYNVFYQQNMWRYPSLFQGSLPPQPVIGSLDLNRKDNFYSPSIVPLGGDQTNVYFGGWRASYSLGSVPECQARDRSAGLAGGQGYTEKVCACTEYKNGTYALDACTGDKIFLATNRFTGNPLSFQVHNGHGYSIDAWSSGEFEPVIWPALLNNSCVRTSPGDCPFAMTHTNDPTVINLGYGEFPFVMYFTGAVKELYQGLWVDGNYTYTAQSRDGVTWTKFSILKRFGGYFPAGLDYNLANGTARAQYDEVSGKIQLITVATNDHPATANHPDAWKNYVHEIDPAQPNVVLSTRVMNLDNFQARTCAPGAPCTFAGVRSWPAALAQPPARTYYPVSTFANDNVPGLSVSQLMDGDVNTVYSSAQFPSADNSRNSFIAAWVPLRVGGTKVDTLRLHAKLSNGTPVGFPKSYHLFLTNADNTNWDYVGQFNHQPVNGVASISLGRTYSTHGVFLVPIELSPDPTRGTGYYFELADLSLSYGTQPQEPPIYTMVTAAASESIPGWPAQHAVDGNPNTIYSSSVFPDASNSRGIFLAAWMAARPEGYSVNTVFLKPRGGTEMQTFPLRYDIYLSNSTNTNWDYVGTYTNQPSGPTDTVAVRLPKTYTTHGIVIVPTQLGHDSYGNHYFQLADIFLGQQP